MNNELLLRRRNLLEKQGKNIRAVCFKADGDQTVAIKQSGFAPTIKMQYSYDGVTWDAWNLKALSFGGDTKVYVRGVNNTQFASYLDKYNYFKFGTDAYVHVSGIAESLLDGENEVLSLNNSYTLLGLFYGQTALRDAEGLKFEALSIDANASYVFFKMFYRCTNLLTAPELLATTLAPRCYNRMFSNCSSLNAIRCHAKVKATDATYLWLEGVASSGTFYGHSAYNWLNNVSGIPKGWKFVELTD